MWRTDEDGVRPHRVENRRTRRLHGRNHREESVREGCRRLADVYFKDATFVHKLWSRELLVSSQNYANSEVASDLPFLRNRVHSFILHQQAHPCIEKLGEKRGITRVRPKALLGCLARSDNGKLQFWCKTTDHCNASKGEEGIGVHVRYPFEYQYQKSYSYLDTAHNLTTRATKPLLFSSHTRHQQQQQGQQRWEIRPKITSKNNGYIYLEAVIPESERPIRAANSDCPEMGEAAVDS
jgi:hypothetical protein